MDDRALPWTSAILLQPTYVHAPIRDESPSQPASAADTSVHRSCIPSRQPAGGASLSVGTPFHPRTAPLNMKMQWREWAGYFASSAYADFHDIEYNAIREAAARHRRQPAVQVPGHAARRDPPRRPGHHPRRDEAQGRAGLLHALVRRARQGHRRRHDPPRRRDTSSAGPPPTPSTAGSTMNAAGLDVEIEDVSERSRRSRSRARTAAPSSRPRPARTSATCATSGAGRRSSPASRSTSAGPATRATSATSCGSRPRPRAAVWDALFAAGQAYAIRPAGMHALDVTRLEAGLIMLEVDYTSRPPRDEPGAELQPVRDRAGQARQLRQGGLRRPPRPQGRGRPGRPGAPARRPPARLVRHRGPVRRPGPAARRSRPFVDRSPVPVFADGRQVGKATSLGWSPILKQAIALAYVPARYERTGTRLQVEWTVEGRRGRVRRDGRRAAVPRPRRASGHDRGGADPSRLRRLRPPRRGAARGLDAGAGRVPARSRPRAATTPALRAAADWTADRLRRLGATVEVLEVDGRPAAGRRRDRRRPADA